MSRQLVFYRFLSVFWMVGLARSVWSWLRFSLIPRRWIDGLYFTFIQGQISLLAVADLNNGCFCNGKGWNWFSCTSLSEKIAETGWAGSTCGSNSLGAGASELFITVEHVIAHNAAETFIFLWLKGICFWLVCNCSTWEYLGAVNLKHFRHECLSVTSENTGVKWPHDKRKQIRANNDLYKTVL